MKSYLFPGQGSQFEGMGKELYQTNPKAKQLFEHANEILGWRITDVMFEGTKEDLTQTKVTQLAVFLESIVRVKINDMYFSPLAVAGHSLGEFTALVAAKSISFEDGVRLVDLRARAMQKACEKVDGTMAAVLGMEDALVEAICAQITDEIVVPANYNSPGQLVISGSRKGIELAAIKLQEAGAKRVIVLPVGGAFHSPLMKPAQDMLSKAIKQTSFQKPICSVYQNVNARAVNDPAEIQQNLVAQLTAPVRWTQIILAMSARGCSHFVEVGGSGSVLKGLVRKINKGVKTDSM
jgi:[acyl-carrier-protein] S-malonyltransferase